MAMATTTVASAAVTAAAPLCSSSSSSSSSSSPGRRWSDVRSSSSWSRRRIQFPTSAALSFLSINARVVSAAAAAAAAATVESGSICCARATSSSSNGISSTSWGKWSFGRGEWRWQAVAEQLQAETEDSAEAGISTDAISIFFEAEGSLSETSVSKLTTILEAVEGVSNVNINASPDGTATVKLTKQSNVQATGVTSSLIEVLIKGGFKLQALNLGFDEDDEDDEDFYDYDLSSGMEETEAAA